MLIVTFAAGSGTVSVGTAVGAAGFATVGRVNAITTVAITKTKAADPKTIQFSCLSLNARTP